MFPILSYFKLKELLILKNILDIRCISHVADQMCIAQPSISRSFSKMRDYFKDPLVVRSGKGMILTPRALELQSILADLFATLEKLEPVTFDPYSHPVEFSIAASDYFAKYIVCNAIIPFLEPSNNISFKILTWNKEIKSRLIEGEIHLAFSIDSEFPSYMFSTIMGHDRLVCVMSKDHPLSTNKKITFDDFNLYHFVHVKTGGGWVNRFLTENNKYYANLVNKVEVSSFHEALILVQNTKLITIVPSHVLNKIPGTNQLITHELPDKVTVQFSAWWHERYHNDLAHKWFRQTFFTLVKHELANILS